MTARDDCRGCQRDSRDRRLNVPSEARIIIVYDFTSYNTKTLIYHCMAVALHTRYINQLIYSETSSFKPDSLKDILHLNDNESRKLF